MIVCSTAMPGFYKNLKHPDILIMISGGAWDNIFGTRKEPTETTHTQYLLERLVDEVASLHMSLKYVYNNVFLYLTICT